ncbi:MAG: 16S rRNA (guanine(527)-N(7))-methyltransferase RsmG [Chitinispirillales bacterium]|jgi:16S rRNA (guanine527-N7)-methyltransferase|nr:16S rRNA (guanine(527)-N(7))-methyltransferase RsmG [Chitinispirillales bacterium]
MNQKDLFQTFLADQFPHEWENFLPKFELFHSWLVRENSKINLISRQTDPADIWTTHFLDSLLSVKYVEFAERRILDFGTGGGLPGIPLAIIYGDASVTLLDSRKKKIESVKEAALRLGLANCVFLGERLEELSSKHDAEFDLIVSRSVRIEPSFRKKLLKLLKPQGKLVLYKSRNLEDTEQFENVQIFDASLPELGERKIIVIQQ